MKQLFLFTTLLAICLNLFSQQAILISTNEAKQDIENMIGEIEATHYNSYFSISKKDFSTKKQLLLSSWNKDSITLKKFMSSGMKLTALLSGGHTYMDWQNPKIIPSLMQHKYVPFTLKINIQDSTFIVTRSEAPNIKIDSQVLTINGIKCFDLFEECKSYIGGIESFKNAYCEKVFPLYLFFNETLKSPYTITNSDQLIVKNEGLPFNDFLTFLTSIQPIQNYTFKFIENNIGLISYNSCTDLKAFDQFLKQTFKELKKKKSTKLIIDIRENNGGESGLNDLLLSYITKQPYQQSSGRYWKVSKLAKEAYVANPIYKTVFGKKIIENYLSTPEQEVIANFNEELTQPTPPKNYFDGKTCFLIGPNTFSSANFLADAVKTYHLSTLIGSVTGENTNDFGEQISFNLRNSEAKVFVSSTYDIGDNGNKEMFEPVYPDYLVNNNALQFAIDWLKNKTN